MVSEKMRWYRSLIAGMGRLIFCAVILLLIPDVLRAGSLSLKEKLGMLGYDDHTAEIIVSGKQAREDLDRALMLEMLGFDDQESAYFMQRGFRDVEELFAHYRRMEQKRICNLKLGTAEFKALLREAGRFFPIVNAAAKKTRVKESLILAMIKVESDFNPLAVSDKGAMGLMQLMPDTARDLGVRKPFDPSQNIWGGASYMAKCINNFRDIRRALAAYNAGPGLVERTKGIPRIKETQDYVRRVLAYEGVFSSLLHRLR
ncbi:hypothetical protein TRIP_B200662 [uncultured Desulfatiglans sp.]|nr:hypothetical protein TRIP_B200662 [uncultured Desulfatiglans sp.]